jgi:hypothetical protein
MSDLDLDAARSETVNEIAGCLYRLIASEPSAHAGAARGLGDEGKVLKPSETAPKRHFIRTEHVDKDSSPLFREVYW